MSYEETLVCDGCSSVLSGGSRRSMLADLHQHGGRAFIAARRERHLCGSCAPTVTVLFDGTPVPEPTPEKELR